MPNRLIHETSPYLLQHAHNPVDWYPWGEEALQRARAEDKPILLSIGYSACHWCHVMEHESFENSDIAALMNEHFINIKVDREERPDLDSIYMTAVQALTGHGGWPMTVFLTPDGTPFYAGTYFPPEDRPGMPGFPRVLRAVLDAYRTKREKVYEAADGIRDRLSTTGAQRQYGALSVEILQQAYQALPEDFDEEYGGFGGAPKFPQAMTLDFVLRTYYRTGDPNALHMVEYTLQRMARGGIYDQIGGGFHRYAVDRYWLVPHFEKMLYDNALLSRLYTETYQATGNPLYRRIAEETLDYVVREMRSPEGGFYSTQDADSEGEEGKFYLWTPDEIRAVLGEDAEIVMRYYGVRPQGNFEGKNILHVPASDAWIASELQIGEDQLHAVLQRARPRLYEARSRRVWPGRDEKVLTAWNGLMLHSFAFAAAVFGRDDYRRVAEENADFLLRTLVRDGRVRRTYKDGQAKLNGYLEDYADLIDGLLALYETTFERRWLESALTLADAMLDLFWHAPTERFFDTSREHEELFVRPRDITDNATPAGNSVAVDVLLRLALLAGREDFRGIGERVLQTLSQGLANFPTAFGRLLCALDFYLGRPKEIAIVGRLDAPATRELLTAVWGRYLPNKVVASMAPGDEESARLIPLLAGRTAVDGRPTAYVCQHYVCQLPVTTPEALARELAAGTASTPP